MVTWGLGSAFLNLASCPSFCSSITEATRKMDTEVMSEALFDYTGVYISQNSVLSPLVGAFKLLGLLLSAMDMPAERNTDNLCPTVCSADLAKTFALAGCGTSLMGALDDTFIEDYVSTKLSCPVSKSTNRPNKLSVILTFQCNSITFTIIFKGGGWECYCRY